MTDIGSTIPDPTRRGLSHAAFSSNPISSNPRGRGLFARLFAYLDGLADTAIDFMTRCLCRASRGYLCPPDMTSVMYPDEDGPPKTGKKECCK